ncbi:MAG: hypothetical protein LUG16_06635, partial [Candidatus Gastranaerophilales bacterium]|nr:hypothetical protein [Candidatus Gastranaerophilales bacterium]
MPEPKYNNLKINTDLYTSMYEQYYFKENYSKPVKPIKKLKRKKEAPLLYKVFSIFACLFLLFFLFPYSFNNFNVSYTQL